MNFIPKDDWPILTRLKAIGRIPYCYKVSDADPLILEPDYKIIKIVEQAFKYIEDGNSLREAASWLSLQTNKKITHVGLETIWRKKRGDDETNPRTILLRKRQKAQKALSKDKKEKIRRGRILGGAKRRVMGAEQKLERIIEYFDSHPIETRAEKADASKTAVQPPIDTKPIPATPLPDLAFKPNDGPQTDFLAASEREVLFGGAAGGGKSYGLLADPMRYFDNHNFNGILVRRTNDELRELKWKARELYPRIFPGCKWREKDSMWVFPSGAQWWLTYLERDEDVLRYQGQAFNYIAFDELTHYASPFAWDYMRSRLRSVDKTLPLFMRATTNPGNLGHAWVKKMFIDPAPPNTPFPATNIETGEMLTWPKDHPKHGTPLFMRRFIPSKLSDNPYLYEDGQYEENLLSLPEGKRRQLLDGDWTIVEGAAFPEFNTRHHVIEPFEIPHSWRKFRSCDFGYNSFSAVHWYAIDPAYETLYVYRELYVSGMTGIDLAHKILEMEAGEKIDYGVLDSSVWSDRGQRGPSIAEEMISAGCRWRPSDRSNGSRVAGKNRLHELLKVKEYGRDIKFPGIMFFNNCRQIIADLQVIPVDPDGGDDINKKFLSDHTYDSIRYGIMTRPRSNAPWYGNVFDTTNRYRPADTLLGY